MKEHSPWAGRPVAPILAPHYRSPGGARVHQLVQQEPPPPRMATCERSRVVCCLRQRQHNPQHMQFTRKREDVVKSRKTALGTFRKKPPPPITGAVCSPARRVSPTSILELSQLSAYDTVVGAGAPSGRADTSAV